MIKKRTVQDKDGSKRLPYADFSVFHSFSFQGYNIKSLSARYAGGDGDAVDITDHEIHKINFVPDFWDLIDAYHSKEGEAARKKSRKKRSAPRPSCSVIIKHMPELEDIYVAHNTWHVYSAMSYR